jgi:hypothetical protein
VTIPIRPPSFGKGLNIADTAQELLEYVIAHWNAAAPGTVTPLPARRLIAPGDPRTIAWDCEQLVISMEGVGFGPAVDIAATSPRAGFGLSVNSLRHVVLTVSLVRCTPPTREDGTPPSVDALQEAGLTFLRDAGLLSQAMVSYAGVLRARIGDDDRSVQCGAITPFGPSGGFHSADAAMAITVPELI